RVAAPTPVVVEAIRGRPVEAGNGAQLQGPRGGRLDQFDLLRDDLLSGHNLEFARGEVATIEDIDLEVVHRFFRGDRPTVVDGADRHPRDDPGGHDPRRGDAVNGGVACHSRAGGLVHRRGEQARQRADADVTGRALTGRGDGASGRADRHTGDAARRDRCGRGDGVDRRVAHHPRGSTGRDVRVFRRGERPGQHVDTDVAGRALARGRDGTCGRAHRHTGDAAGGYHSRRGDGV